MKFSDMAIEQVGWGHRRIEGYGLMTATQYVVLEYLHQCEVQDFPWVDLCEVHGSTINRLMERDWIVESRVVGEARYKITTRGRRALRMFSAPLQPRRSDGICPSCGERPKRVRRSGVLAPYCGECEREMGIQRRSLGLYPKKPGICPRCKERPKHITSSGNVRPHCQECRRENRAEEKRKQNQRNLERLENGEVLLCYICHEQPREVANGWVRDYCPDCGRAYMREYNRRRRS